MVDLYGCFWITSSHFLSHFFFSFRVVALINPSIIVDAVLNCAIFRCSYRSLNSVAFSLVSPVNLSILEFSDLMLFLIVFDNDIIYFRY